MGIECFETVTRRKTDIEPLIRLRLGNGTLWLDAWKQFDLLLAELEDWACQAEHYGRGMNSNADEAGRLDDERYTWKQRAEASEPLADAIRTAAASLGVEPDALAEWIHDGGIGRMRDALSAIHHKPYREPGGPGTLEDLRYARGCDKARELIAEFDALERAEETT